MQVAQLFGKLWARYLAMAPQVEEVHAALAEGGDKLKTDHIAIRTFDVDAIGIESLDRVFVADGYEPVDSWQVDGSHIEVVWYEHALPSLPKLLISSISLDAMPPAVQAIVVRLVAQVPPGMASTRDFVSIGRPWDLSTTEYHEIKECSAYAAWVAAMGFCAAHFAIDISGLASVGDLAKVRELINDLAVPCDDNFGAGAVARGVEICATRADVQEVQFVDTTLNLSTCRSVFLQRGVVGGEPFSGLLPEVVPALVRC